MTNRATESNTDDHTVGPALKRSLSLPLITLYGLGTTIGAGIYVLVGKVAGRAGLFAPISFLVAALIAGLTACAFAELSARYPKSAGEAIYVREGLRSARLALAVGLLVVTAGSVSAAAISVGAAGYVRELFDLPHGATVLVLIVVLGALAAWGIIESVTAACLFTLIEIAGLVLVVGVVGAGLDDHAPQLVELVPPFEVAAWSGILSGGLLAFYAFIGFEDMVNVAEEVKDVTRVLPLAIGLTLALTMLVYLPVSIVAVLAAPPAELAASDAPLAYLYRQYGGSPTVITAIAIFATLNGALIQIVMASRVLYGLSAQGALPAAIGRINPRTRTPLVATAMVVGVIAALALWLPIEPLAETTSVITLAIFALVNLALIMIKRRDPRPAGVPVFPAVVPYAGLIASAGFLLLALFGLFGG